NRAADTGNTKSVQAPLILFFAERLTYSFIWRTAWEGTEYFLVDALRNYSRIGARYCKITVFSNEAPDFGDAGSRGYQVVKGIRRNKMVVWPCLRVNIASPLASFLRPQHFRIKGHQELPASGIDQKVFDCRIHF